MKNLVVRSHLIASALSVGFTFLASHAHAQERNLKAELLADFDRIEAVVWKDPTNQTVLGLIDEESANVAQLSKDGLKALPALIEIMESSSSRFSNTTKMMAMGVATKAVKSDEVLAAWEANVSNSGKVQLNKEAVENILMAQMLTDEEGKIIDKQITNVSGSNKEMQAASLHFLRNFILTIEKQGMEFTFAPEAGVQNPFRTLTDDSHLEVRQDALFLLIKAGNDEDLAFVTEKMLDPKYDVETKLDLPSLIVSKNSDKSFEPLKKLLDAKDASGNPYPEILRAKCVEALAECTTEVVGEMVPVQNDDRVDELRTLFNKIFQNGTEYRLRYTAFVALTHAPFLTPENSEKLMDAAEAVLKDESLPMGFKARVGQAYMVMMMQMPNAEEIMKKRMKKLQDEAAAKKAPNKSPVEAPKVPASDPKK